jgi:cell division protein FtsB
MKNLLPRLLASLKNFYVLATIGFFVWLLIFDSNDLITQFSLRKKEAELQETKKFYEEKILEVKADREALLNNSALLEKIAREKYLMKRSGEDIYIIVED